MTRNQIVILLLMGWTTALFAAADADRDPDWLPSLCVKWLLGGEIENRWSDKSAREWAEEGVLHFRAGVKNEKRYADTIPVVLLGYSPPHETWFSFVRTNQTLVRISGGTNTMSSPALEIIPCGFTGNTQDVRIVYSLNMFGLDVITKEGGEPRVILREYRLSD